MKIIIVGNGKVGYAIARQLAVEGHDITMVDSSPVALARADSTLDLMCVEGNGASISVLEEAGARTADLVIAVSNLDETNLVCCLIAKTMGAKHTIARVRNPDYRRDAALLKREIGMDMVINPDLAAAREIARILSFPSASSVEPFAGGRIDMIGIQVTERDRFYGVALSEFHRIRSAEVLICAAQRGDECIIPNGNFVPREGDKLYMVGTKSELQKMLRAMGRTQQRVKTVSLLGGSRIAMYLTWELAVSNTKVCIVEQKHDKCLQLAAQLPTAMIIEGDGTEEELLTSETQQPPPDGPHPQGGRLQLPALREKEGLQNGHRHGDQQHLEHGERGYGALAGQGVEDGLEKDQRQGIDSHMKFHGQAPAVETDKFSHDGPPFYSPSRSRSRGA